MTNTARDYWGFYLEGRAGHRPRGLTLDIPALVTQALAAQTCHGFRDMVRTAVAKAIADRSGARVAERKKSEWLEENEEEITERKLDKDIAYEYWMTGRIDEVTNAVESEVLDEMEQEVEQEAE